MQEIIVYRNPLEAAMWHALGDGRLFPIICGIFAFFVVFLVSNHFITGGTSCKTPAWKTNAALGLGVLAACGVIWGMWL